MPHLQTAKETRPAIGEIVCGREVVYRELVTRFNAQGEPYSYVVIVTK